MVFFCYKPNWTFTVYDLRVLEEPEHTEGCMDGMVQPTDDPNWYENSSCGWPVGKSYLAWASTLEERAPEVAKFLGNVQLNGEIVTDFNYHVSYQGEDAVEYAKGWVAENTDLIDSWLNQ
jgi:glycine betaine/proline transport system substrate-binding protein